MKMDFYIIGKQNNLASKVFKCASVLDAKVRFVIPDDNINPKNSSRYICFIESAYLSLQVLNQIDKRKIIVLKDSTSLEPECDYLRKGYRGVLHTDLSPQLIIGQLQALLESVELLFSRAALSQIASEYVTKREEELKPISVLTRKENQIVNYIHSGLQNKEIARELAISPATVKTHVQRILKKTGAKNRTQILSKTAML